jgi:hypothetical protein
VADLVAYFDESGTHADSNMTVVAAFVSDAARWKRFTEEWQSALKDFGIQHFHMNQYESRFGQFLDWSNDDRKSRLAWLLSIIEEHVSWSMSCTVFREPVETIMSKQVEKRLGGLYGLGAQQCWRHIGEVVRPFDAWVESVMESGAQGSKTLGHLYQLNSQLDEWRDLNRISSLEFRNGKDFPPLQAADILAYEVWKQCLRQFGDETRDPRHPIRELSQKPHQWMYFTDQHLRELNASASALGLAG